MYQKLSFCFIQEKELNNFYFLYIINFDSYICKRKFMSFLIMHNYYYYFI